ncbi:MAG: hypothetical protein E7314_06100 [Clostridiales bacterium]|nr:hypothetical protein [Clostridiales bacterium]
MKKILKKENGSIMFPVGVMVFLILIFMFIFFIVVSKSTVNMVLHEIRSDLYLINQNAIFAIQKDLMGEDISCLYEGELETLIAQGIKKSWELDGRLKNGQGLIKEAKIKNVLVLEEGDLDPVDKKLSDTLMVHTVIKVKIKPVIFESLLKDKSEFEFHTDLHIEKIEL